MAAEQVVLVEGLEERAAAPSAIVPPSEPKVRLKAVDRQQICFRVIDPDRLVGEDHPVRAIWDLLGQLDLSPFDEGIKAVEGRPGRDRSDPQVLIALWLYAISRGVREARPLDEWAQYEPGCQWLLGLGRINYHTLSPGHFGLRTGECELRSHNAVDSKEVGITLSLAMDSEHSKFPRQGPLGTAERTLTSCPGGVTGETLGLQ